MNTPIFGSKIYADLWSPYVLYQPAKYIVRVARLALTGSSIWYLIKFGFESVAINDFKHFSVDFTRFSFSIL